MTFITGSPLPKVLHWVEGFINSCSELARHEAEKGPGGAAAGGGYVAGALGAWHPTESIERGASAKGAALGWLENLSSSLLESVLVCQCALPAVNPCQLSGSYSKDTCMCC